MPIARILLLLMLGVPLGLAAAAQHEHQHPAGDPQQLGEVHFVTSCEQVVQEEINRAVAMLHSFWYDKVAAQFAAIARQDPACAMAFWGVAMSHYHPLWEAPGEESLRSGRAAIEKAQAVGAKTQRERDYIATLARFYQDFEKVDHLTRARAYEEAMQRLHQLYPDDKEAAVFYALSLLGTAAAAPPDPTLAKQEQAGRILEKLFAEQPDHPGLAHYIIHSYDYPPLAAQALEAARRYAKIAPDSPHALHMPSHIFTRLGHWEESIASNLSAAASARKYDWPGEAAHASDYLIYAYLQLAQDEKARQVLQSLPAPRKGDPNYVAGLYANAASPARYIVERTEWAEAASLKAKPGTSPGGRYAWTEATLHFVRGLAAARAGDTETAAESLTLLEAAREAVRRAKDDYWAEQVEVQRQTVAAWLAEANGKKTKALELMRAAADLEDTLGKHPVTPGAIVPARELLGEMLLQTEQPREALQEFEAVLHAAPNRFNALFGAAQAAERAGDLDRAESYYTKLLELAAAGDGDRPALKKAATFLAKQ